MDRTTWRLFSLKSVNDIFSLENENHIILPKDVKMSQDIHAYLNKTNFYVECMHWDKHGILDGFINHKQNMYPSNNECDIGKSICDKLFNKYKTHDFKWSNQSYTSIASSLYKHMRVYSTYLKNRRAFLRAHACIRWTTIAWAHQIWWRQIENSRKVSVLLKAISSVLWIPTFLQKMFSMTKIGRFLRGFSVVDFSVVGFLDLLKTLKTQRQKSLFLYKSDFHWQRCISSCI